MDEFLRRKNETMTHFITHHLAEIIVLEVVTVLLILFGFYNEKKIIALEDKVIKAIRKIFRRLAFKVKQHIRNVYIILELKRRRIKKHFIRKWSGELGFTVIKNDRTAVAIPNGQKEMLSAEHSYSNTGRKENQCQQ